MSEKLVAATIPSMELPTAHALASRTQCGRRNRFGDAVVAHLGLIRAQRHGGERTP